MYLDDKGAIQSNQNEQMVGVMQQTINEMEAVIQQLKTQLQSKDEMYEALKNSKDSVLEDKIADRKADRLA